VSRNAAADLRVLDLFSGIGGFGLGLERAGGFRVAAFCEISAFCRRVLATHWPEVRCYHDIQALTAERLAADGIRVDVIAGGFPCQDISVAGAGAGLDGVRSGLWWEYARLIDEIRPRWAIIENVGALRSRGLDVVLWSLVALGYDARWNCIPASRLGAPHQRDRVWIVAHAARGGARRDGERRQPVVDCRTTDVADAHGQGLEKRVAEDASRAWALGWPDPERSDWWAVEPDVGRVAHGIPDRVDRLHALGNAVVPQIPEYLGRIVLAAEARFAEACHAQ
jgi:DNA (cytosine-5)-methyltransferase 1